MRGRLVVCALLVTAAESSARAQDAELLIDLNTAPSRASGFSVDSPVLFQGSTFFVREGSQLWKTDGTRAGTNRVFEFPPERNCWSIAALASRLVITCGGSDAGAEIYTSDGTAEGTTPLANDDFETTTASLVFSDADRAAIVRNGRELWITDGTPAGTHQRGQVRSWNIGGWPLIQGDVIRDNRTYYRLEGDGELTLLLERAEAPIVTDDVIYVPDAATGTSSLTRLDGRTTFVIETEDDWQFALNAGASLFLQADGRILELAPTSTAVEIFAADELTRTTALVGAGPNFVLLADSFERALFVRDRSGETTRVDLLHTRIVSRRGHVFAFSADGIFEIDRGGATRIAPSTALNGQPWKPGEHFMLIREDQIHGVGRDELEPLLEAGLTDNGHAYPSGFVSSGDARTVAFWAHGGEDASGLYITDGTGEGTNRVLDRPAGKSTVLATEHLFFVLDEFQSQILIVSHAGIEETVTFESAQELSQAGRTVIAKATLLGTEGLFAVRPGKAPRQLFAGPHAAFLTPHGESMYFLSREDLNAQWTLFLMEENGDLATIGVLDMEDPAVILPAGDRAWMLSRDRRTAESSSGVKLEIGSARAPILGQVTCGDSSVLSDTLGRQIIAREFEVGILEVPFVLEALPRCLSGQLFIQGWSEEVGAELFTIEGDVAVLAHDVAEGIVSSHAAPIGAVRDTMFFVAQDDENGGELHAYRDGAVRRIEGRLGPASGAIRSSGIAEANGFVLYAGYDVEHGLEVWRAPLSEIIPRREDEGSGESCGCANIQGERTRPALGVLGFVLFLVGLGRGRRKRR